jgi:hypothetical protein
MVTRSVLVQFNNDATACFDQKLVHLLNLCLRSFGMPKKLTKIILGELLKVARYAIKTGIGISEETYQHSDESPAFGSGQGSEAPAQGWTKLVSKLFDIHDKHGHRCKYEVPWKIYTAIITMLGLHKNLNKTSGSHLRRLVCSAMSPRCAWLHYTAVFQRSVGYPLGMCHLSESQLHDLQKKYILALLNKIGIIQRHAHSLIFGLRSYGGIGCNDLRIEQGIDLIENLIRQLRTPGYGKQMATIFLQTLQHTSGMTQPLLQ